MAVIPAGVFRRVEWCLHNESGMLEKAIQARRNTIEDVLQGCGLKDDGMPKGKGGHSEATANKAMVLIKASEEVETARSWVQAIQETYEYFNGSMVCDMAKSYYGKDITITALAEQIGTNKKTLDRMRDKFVCTCAIFAAAQGLVKIRGEDRREEACESV